MVKTAAQVTTPISKAGILSDKRMNRRRKQEVRMWIRSGAFTFVEVMVALAIVSISLVTLIGLHLVSIRLVQTAEVTSEAVFLAQEKIAELLAQGYPAEGSDCGTVEKGPLCLYWQSEVSPLQLPELERAGVTGLRKISVDIGWKQGTRQKHLEMSTYVADRKLQ